jgi:hypothetical protein
MPSQLREEDGEHSRVVRDERVARRPVSRRGQHTSHEVRFRVQERAAMRIEDVRVEQMHRIGDDRPRHPRHVPERKLAVAAVGAGVPARVDRYRIQQQRRERRARQHHQPAFAPRHWPAGLVCHVVVSASAYSGTRRTRAPRNRLSLLPGASRNGTKPAPARIDTGYR